jgi:hypothetical protein
MDPWRNHPLHAASLGEQLPGEVFLALPEIDIQAVDDYRRYKVHQAAQRASRTARRDVVIRNIGAAQASYSPRT